jgi:replicative DNA helicase/5S rRNA maturation endonuclease (ribonuclease M5)
MEAIAAERPETKTEALIKNQGWTSRPAGNGDNVAIQVCPFCNADGWKFFIAVGGEKDSLYKCHRCGEEGNYHTLREKLGISSRNTVSLQDTVMARTPAEAMPNFEAMHRKLMTDDEYGPVLDYLVSERKFNVETIEALKLGAAKLDGELAYVIPYFDAAGVGVFYKLRTVPPAKKRFKGASGRENPLYNEAVLKAGMDELVMVEGEADAIALISAGYKTVVGIPGAGQKKASWTDKLDRLAPKQIYLLYDSDKVGQDAAHEMAIRIGLEKCRNIVLPAFEKADSAPGKDINEWLAVGHTLEELEQLKADSRPFDVQGVQSLADVLDDLKGELTEHGTEPKYKTPWPSLNKRVGGFEDGDVCGLMAEGKVGKLQGYSAKILTPFGWTRMGALKPGDQLVSIDGESSTVTAIVEHGVKQLFKVTFSDGRSTRCGLEHLWQVGCVDNFGRDGYRVVDTETLIHLLNGKEEWFVPLFSGNISADIGLPMNPWLLGALLGDGALSNNCSFSKTDPLVLEAVNRCMRDYGCELVKKSGSECDYSIVGINRGNNHIRRLLRRLGLFGCLSTQKFIPGRYMDAGREQRLELLRGLMDTDGSAEGNYGVPCFNTSSLRLASQVQELVWSLGGVASITERTPTYTHNDEKKTGNTAYRVLVKLNDPVFRHSHKAAKECKRTRQFRLKIVSIVPDGKEEARCIKVSHPSSLYITDDYIVTHNTTMALDWVDWYAENGTPSMLFCGEMKAVRLVRKWVSYKLQIDDTPNRSEFKPEHVDQAIELVPNYKADLLFGYSRSNKPDEVFSTIRQAVRRYGVKVVCYDNLQLMSRSMEHQTQEISKLTKEFKSLAMELNIFIILIIQPNRVAEGQIVAARNAMGSSAIEKDVDCMICLHRKRIGKISDSEFNGYMDTEENFEPHLLVRVDLSRFSPGGMCTLWFDGARSTVREMVEADISAIPKPTGAIEEAPIEA